MFQKRMVNSGVEGIQNVMVDLKIISGKIIKQNNTIICSRSYWVRVDQGGVLYVHPELKDIIAEGDEIAHLTDIFGSYIKNFKTQERGIVIGKSNNPVTYTGGRILHLGIIGDVDSHDSYMEDEVEDSDEDY